MMLPSSLNSTSYSRMSEASKTVSSKSYTPALIMALVALNNKGGGISSFLNSNLNCSRFHVFLVNISLVSSTAFITLSSGVSQENKTTILIIIKNVFLFFIFFYFLLFLENVLNHCLETISYARASITINTLYPHIFNTNIDFFVGSPY